MFDWFKRTGSRNDSAAYTAGLLSIDAIQPSDLRHKYLCDSLAWFLAPHGER